ncbi:MAG TPA: sterol desaturase family protein [Burkholderiales bacterium]|jgi:sterol desaturase/sphingolipid hydroxylase (fatty acid hydroxylase superfamily)|nr:sterol desaturase family protein [Burkholderiales bacterium]
MTQRSCAAGTALMLGGLAALLWLERKRPLRAAVEPRLRHNARNLAVGVVTAVTVSLVERPIVTRVAQMTEERGWGLTRHLALPPALQAAVTVALMDYTLYWWHVLLHRIPALWRLHEPHHIDRDLDASTAIRFHFTEFLASVPWRCAQIVLIGAGPRTLALWQKLTLAEVLFHHSNVCLPRALERVLSRFIVTPRMHGIHHSIVRDERDSNFSSGLSAWDGLHGTARIDVCRDAVTIGLPGYTNPAEVTLVKTLALPFVESPGRGDHPQTT